jgi:hypothetical protein
MEKNEVKVVYIEKFSRAYLSIKKNSMSSGLRWVRGGESGKKNETEVEGPFGLL